MTTITLIFLLVYLGMILGGFPYPKIGRPAIALDYALGAALLMELELCDRIDTDLEILKVISTASVG